MGYSYARARIDDPVFLPVDFSFFVVESILIKVLGKTALNKIRVAVSKGERLLYFKSVKKRGLSS